MCARRCGCGGTLLNYCAAVGQHPERAGLPSPRSKGNSPAFPCCSWDSARKLFPVESAITQKISNQTRSPCRPARAPAQTVASTRPLLMGRYCKSNFCHCIHFAYTDRMNGCSCHSPKRFFEVILATHSLQIELPPSVHQKTRNGALGGARNSAPNRTATIPVYDNAWNDRRGEPDRLPRSHVGSPRCRILCHAHTDTFLKTAVAGRALSSTCPASSSERGIHKLACRRIGR